MSKKLLVLPTALILLLGGCGSGTDPLDLGGDPSSSVAFMELALPMATSLGSLNSLQGYTSTHQSFQWTFSGIIASVAASSPASGVVVGIDSTVNAGVVTIQHNAHLKTQVSGLQTVTVRVGDSVVAGSAIGNIAPSTSVPVTTITLTVYMDGTAVCPYSFMSSTARTFIHSNYTNAGFAGAGQYCQ